MNKSEASAFSASVKEIDYVQLGIVNQAELKLQPKAFFSFYTDVYTKLDRVTKSLADPKDYVEKLKIEVTIDLKEIPDKLIEFNNSILALTTEVAKLEWFKLDIPPNLLASSGSFTNVSSQVAKLKVLDAIPDIMNMVADKGKKAMTLKEQSFKEERGSESDLDDETQASGPIIESSKTKKPKKIYFVTESDYGLVDGTTSYPIGIVKNVEVHIGRLKLLEDLCVIDMEKDPVTPLLIGRGFLATASTVIDCRKAKVAVGEGVNRLVFGVKEINLGGEEMPYWTTLGKRESYGPRLSKDGICAHPTFYARKYFFYYHLPEEWEIARDVKLNPFKDVLVFRKMVEFLGTIHINLKGNMWELNELIENRIGWNKPPKEGDGAWHAKVRLIDPDEEEFTRTFQSIPTTRNFSKKENCCRSCKLTKSLTTP
uniref:Uncharacterized protein n=1 Tax=Tanacetum cinerariifolium TaxID=118510 RepID=A0A6L2LVW1_TANCI|nr:hypothetical protein [Tanacetum cinerariifolium]